MLYITGINFSSSLVLNMLEVSIVLNSKNLYTGLNLRSNLPGCLFLKYTLSSILKVGSFLSMVLCAALK